jgi:hypothetical protein
LFDALYSGYVLRRYLSRHLVERGANDGVNVLPAEKDPLCSEGTSHAVSPI